VSDPAGPKLYLDGFLLVPPDRLAAVMAALPAHIALTRAEPGCLAFSVEPDATVPGRFIVAEIFTDQPSFDAHQRRVAQSDWGRVTQDLVRDYSIRRGPPL
jgi:quinol monooxygenase YgiN